MLLDKNTFSYSLLVVGVILYTLLHIILINDDHHTSCSEHFEYSKWSDKWAFGTIWVFFSSFLVNLLRILSVPVNNFQYNTLVIFSIALAINLFAGASSLFDYIYFSDKICSDTFG